VPWLLPTESACPRGKLAYSHSIQPLDDSKFSLTVRVSDGYRKINGKWSLE